MKMLLRTSAYRARVAHRCRPQQYLDNTSARKWADAIIKNVLTNTWLKEHQARDHDAL